jgi:hypothetical protein
MISYFLFLLIRNKIINVYKLLINKPIIHRTLIIIDVKIERNMSEFDRIYKNYKESLVNKLK